jgi:hypothetical protein
MTFSADYYLVNQFFTNLSYSLGTVDALAYGYNLIKNN